MSKKMSKPSMAKAKKMVTKQRKQKAKRNMDTFFLKTTNTVTITPSQGTTVSNYIYRVFTLDPADTATSLFTQNAEYNLFRLQYDKFRVNSVKVIVVPKANVLDQTHAQDDTNLNTGGDGLVHTCIDRDGPAPSSTAVISRYPSYRKYSVLKPFTRSYSIKYPMGVWLDCQAPSDFSLDKELGLGGGVTIYAESLLEDNNELFNEPWATITVQYNIVFQGKVSNKLSGVYDASNNLIGVTINAVTSGDLLDQTPLVNISGTLDQDTKTDLSGNQVAVNDMGVPVL